MWADLQMWPAQLEVMLAPWKSIISVAAILTSVVTVPVSLVVLGKTSASPVAVNGLKKKIEGLEAQYAVLTKKTKLLDDKVERLKFLEISQGTVADVNA